MNAIELASAPVIDARRIRALDGLRGIAIILVFMFHAVFTGALETTRPDAALIRGTHWGWIGVNLFFVLSGFLITSILLDSKSSRAPVFFRNFYARRALRIWPLYVAFALLLMYVLPLVSGEGDIARAIRDQQVWIWTYMINYGYYFDSGFAFTPYVNHLWSLAIEEQFYLIWPLAVFALRGRALAAAAVLAIAGGMIARSVFYAQDVTPINIYTLTPARMDDLAWGALIAIALRSPEGRRLASMVAWPLALAGFTGFVTLYAMQGTFLPDTSGLTLILGISVVGMMFAGFVAAAALAPPDGAFAKGLSNRVLTTFGKYSYALYVFHYPVLLLLAGHSSFTSSIPSVGGSTTPGALVFTSVAVAITFALSLATWHLLEQPFLRLRHYFPGGTVSGSMANVAEPPPLVVEPGLTVPLTVSAVLGADDVLPVAKG